MATKAEDIREELKRKSEQQINPLLKGLSMLTGGLAGEFTGTNEQIRQQRQARRALMEENLAALQEERIMERMKQQQSEMLKRQLEFDEAQRLAATRARVAEARGQANVLAGRDVMGPLEPAEQAGMEIARANIARAEAERIRGLEAARPEMTGYLAAQGVQTGEPDIETLQFLTSQQRAKEAIQKEARQAKREEGQVYISRNAEGQVSVQGPADKVAEYQKANPDLFSKQKGAPYRIRLQPGMEGNQLFADFGDMTTEEIEKIQPNIMRLQKVYGGGVFSDGGETETQTKKSLIKGPAAEKGAPQVGRVTGAARGGAAASVASEMGATTTPDMYGPLSPREQFVQTGRRLGALEGRGGTSTYGAQQTLTNPFYEAVAQELGTQPQRVGSESVLVKGAKAVIASEFPTEQWNKLPQEVQNRIYIEALNRSAAEMAKPPQQKGVFGMGYAESPFASYSIKRD